MCWTTFYRKEAIVPIFSKMTCWITYAKFNHISSWSAMIMTFLALVFLLSFTATNMQLCMRYLKNDFYTQFEDIKNLCFSNEGLTYCAFILQPKNSKFMLKSYIIKSRYRSTIFFIWFKGCLSFSNGYPFFNLKFIVWSCYRKSSKTWYKRG